MSQIIKQNKFILSALVITIVLAGMTFGNIPAPPVPQGVQTVNGTTYNFANYYSLTHEQIALYNYLTSIVVNEPVNSFDNWAANQFWGYLHYMLAFSQYVLASVFETTPGYRTEFYEDPAQQLIAKMNTTFAVHENESIEYIEWLYRGFEVYYWPNATDTNDLYVGDYRGPANIMWTGHYALMEALYERSFNTGDYIDEITWFVEDWNNSLTTDGFGNPQEGGIWETGLIPCEPYIVFSQCNSIPIFATELYDNLYDTQWMESGMWDYGLNFINTLMHDYYGLFIDGYFVQKPIGATISTTAPEVVPNPAIDIHTTDGRPKDNSYGTAWALTFLEYTQPTLSIADYDLFMDTYGVDVSADKMHMVGSQNNIGTFGDVDGMLGTFFASVLANQRGDYVTRDRLQNFLTGAYNKVWSADGREMYYDTSVLLDFLKPVTAGFKIWSTVPVTVRDLADARPSGFWDWPYISDADDDNIWVYQAEWDAANEAFILNIKVDETATLTFSNFDSTPTAYTHGSAFGDFVLSGDDYTLTLTPGSYNIVIVEGGS
jgi:hypothetical protein